MTPRLAVPLLALAALGVCAPVAGAATKPKPKTTPLDLVLELGYTDTPSAVGTVVGAVSGKGIAAAGFRVRLTAKGDSATGPVAIYDGLGELDGTLALEQTRGANDAIALKGTLTISGGSGRWSGAKGKLAFAGGLDSTAVPLVTVVRGTAKGTVRATPAAVPPAAKPRIRTVDVSGDESKIDFEPGGPTQIAAGLIGGSEPKPGIVVWRKGAVSGDAIPATFVLYTASGTLKGAGTLSRANKPSTVKVTGGTGRFKSTRGSLRWTAKSTGTGSGRFTSRLQGKLRF